MFARSKSEKGFKPAESPTETLATQAIQSDENAVNKTTREHQEIFLVQKESILR